MTAGERLTRRRAPLVALLVAHGVSMTGNMLTLVAVPWFVLQTTGSAAQTGVVAFFATLPVLVAGPFGGVLVDRIGYRRASIVADLASGATIVGVPLLFATVGLEFWQLLLLVFASGLLDVPGETARSALLPDLADQAGTTLERATSAFDAVERAARMIGGPLAGVLIAVLGASNVLLVDAATFAVAAGVMALPVSASDGPKAAEPTADGYLRQLREGLAFLRGDRLLRSIVAMLMLTNLFDAALFTVVIPVYADRVLGSPVALGLMSGALGAGALCGAVVYGAAGGRHSRHLVFTAAFLVVGGPRFFVLAAFPPAWIAIAALAVAGFAAGALNPIISTVKLERVPAGMRARVAGVVRAGAWSVMPLGGLLAGAAIGRAGLRATLLVLGGLYLAVTLIPLVRPVWRQMDAPARILADLTPRTGMGASSRGYAVARGRGLDQHRSDDG